jgi:hypothetical protein
MYPHKLFGYDASIAHIPNQGKSRAKIFFAAEDEFTIFPNDIGWKGFPIGFSLDKEKPS